MNAMQSYDPQIFECLPEFHVSKRSLNTSKAHLRELGSVICRHGLQEKVGISLLHKHFSISPYEQLVKEFSENKAYLRPHPQREGDKRIPYLWKFQTDKGTVVGAYYPLEFLSWTDQTTEAKELAETVSNAEDFHLDMAAKLLELGLENVFGISTLHNAKAIKIGWDETMLETTDHETRMLTLAPVSKTQLSLEDSTETLWQFISVVEREAKTDCISHCISHCVHL